jgi:hypothetical protein
MLTLKKPWTEVLQRIHRSEAERCGIDCLEKTIFIQLGLEKTAEQQAQGVYRLWEFTNVRVGYEAPAQQRKAPVRQVKAGEFSLGFGRLRTLSDLDHLKVLRRKMNIA